MDAPPGEVYLRALLETDTRFSRFLIHGVRSTGRELGRGAYGSVDEVEVGAIHCAAKKIHGDLLQRVNITKFVEELQLMTDLRHPHIVQFLGISFLPPASLPVLVMEKLHTSLDDLLTLHADHPPLLAAPEIPLALKRSMFVDISRGLVFLHDHRPEPIVHRDLSAKNVLLTMLLMAKISDLGNARMMQLQPAAQMAALSRVPGTPVYMAPEAFQVQPSYGPKLDIFSLGHLMLYTLIQIFPWNLADTTYPNPNGRHLPRIGRSEVERRHDYMTRVRQQFGEEHPLIQLMEDCLANDPEERPSAEDVLQQLQQMNIDDPYQNATKLDMIRMVGQREEEIERIDRESQQKDDDIRQNEGTIRQKDEEIREKNEEIGRNEQTIRQRNEEIQRRGREIQRRDAELRQNQRMIREKEGEIRRKEGEIRRKDEEIRQKNMDVQQKEADLEQKRREVEQKDGEKQMLEAQVQQLQAQHISEVEALSQQVSAVSEDNSNLSSLLEAKINSLQVKEQQIDVVRRELVVREREVNGKSKKLDAKQQQIDSVTQQDQARSELIKSLQKQLSGKEQELSAKEKLHRDQLSAKEQLHNDQLLAKERELAARESFYQDQLLTQEKLHRDQLLAKEQDLSALVDRFQQHTEGISQERAALQQELVSTREGLQTKNTEIEVQRERVRTTEEEVRVKAAEMRSKDALLQSKERLVQSKDRTVQSLRREVESLRQRGPEQVTFLHPGEVSLEWKQCADLPVGMRHTRQAVQLNTKVYVQGYITPSCSTNSTIFIYEVPADTWESIESPVYWSALTVYLSKLVLVGGIESNTMKVTNQLWVLKDEQTWTQPLPPMPTARCSATAISRGNHLVVAGGDISNSGTKLIYTVKVFDGRQWMRTAPLPVACSFSKATYNSGVWYLIGGIGQSKSVFYTSLDSLIENATRRQYSSRQESVWKTLPDVPCQYSSTTTLGGALLAVGGMGISGSSISSVHAYFPKSTRSWVHVGDAPQAVYSSCCVTLTTGETLMIGGVVEIEQPSCRVYKLDLKLQ